MHHEICHKRVHTGPNNCDTQIVVRILHGSGYGYEYEKNEVECIEEIYRRFKINPHMERRLRETPISLCSFCTDFRRISCRQIIRRWWRLKFYPFRHCHVPYGGSAFVMHHLNSGPRSNNYIKL
jgi:hypothetical protein